MRRFIALLVLALLVTCSPGCSATARTERFVDEWAERLAELENPADVCGTPSVEWPDLVYVRRFSCGEWIAARTEFSCDGGAGFDATAFADSSGRVSYQIGYHFCGHDALDHELSSVEATNLAAFYKALESVGELRFGEW